MSSSERREYTAYRNKSLKERDYIVSAEEKGIEIGEARGKAERDIEIAVNLLKAGVGVDIIEQTTGLSKEQIEKLR